MADDNNEMTKDQIRKDLARRLKDVLAKHETALKEMSARETRGLARLAKSDCMAKGCSATLHKCGEMSRGKVAKSLDSELIGMAKDEMEAGPGCPECNGDRVVHLGDRVVHLGDLGKRSHFMCRHCGMSFSHAHQATGDESVKDDPMAKGDKAAALTEIEPNRSADYKASPGSVLPEDKAPKKVGGDGSGGDLKKDALAGAVPTKRYSDAGPRPGKVQERGYHRQHMADVMDQHSAKKAGPALRPIEAPPLDELVGTMAPGIPSRVQTPTGGRPVPFVKKPAATDRPEKITPMAPSVDINDAANLAADKKAAGVGFLRNLITRFKGIGNSTWQDLRGAGPASTGRSLATMGTRMARSEMPVKKAALPAAPKPPAAPKAPAASKPPTVAKASAKEANKEIAGFQSLASDPTATPKFPGIKPDRAKEANKEMSNFQSLASNPTATPRFPGIKSK